MTENEKKWADKAGKERTTSKWLKMGTEVTIDPDQPEDLPKLMTIDGKFGKRQAYVVETQEFGRVFVSIAQFCKIAEDLNRFGYKNRVTVKLV